ncbi:MAG TPA: 50S ribosomal protein L11 methyltransferase [Sphingobacteriaceae bacterium]|nr:50S ribosomal protein L11 methyltransferase [Sphingobacteriaceae bacterium]
MNYKEFIFTIISEEDYHRDLLIHALGNIGFDTFEETDSGFKAYIPSDLANQKQLDEVLLSFEGDFNFSYLVNLIPQKNWNTLWESNFKPLTIGSCYVRATFHTPHPEFPYEIIIDPKMAFGTGHHETTAMMMELMLEEDFKDKQVLDMGCGTGILAILASRLGAKQVVAIDNDPVCFDSTLENVQLNKIDNITAVCGSREVIPKEKFNIILANINRNILLDQLPQYKENLAPGGILFLSGFFDSPDLEIIDKKAEELQLKFVTKSKQKEWVAAKFKLLA